MWRSRLPPMLKFRRFATARLLFAAGVLTATASIAGCASHANAAAAAPDVSETGNSTVAPTTQSKVTDAQSCEEFSDVLTILHNAMVGLNEERMTEQEYDGWLRLATRVLDRIHTTGQGAVSDGIAALKAAAPAISLETIPVGKSGTPIGTPDWYNAAPLNDACSAAGYQLSAEGFTGG